MSDATFRIHDWGRLGPDGRPRALHLAEALESTDFRAGPVDPIAPEAEPIAAGTPLRLFPWVRLFRGVGASIDSKKLILAAAGLALSAAGWADLDRLFARPIA